MRIKKYLIGMIIFSMLLSIPLIARKVSIESSDKKVDFILDYYQVGELAEQSEKPIEWWLKEFSNMGVKTVGINYETIESMVKENRKIQADIISNIVKDTSWRSDYPYDVINYIDDESTDKYDLVVRFEEYSDYEFASKGLKEKYGDKIKLFSGTDSNYIIIDAKYKDGLVSAKDTLFDSEGKVAIKGEKIDSSKARLLPIGIDPEKVEQISKVGMKISPRIGNAPKGWTTDKYLDSVKKDFEELDVVSPYVMFYGEEVLGYPKKIDDTIKFLNRNNLQLGIVETVVERSYSEQDGLDKLIEKIGYGVNKVYSVPDYIQKRYKYMNYEGGEEIGNVLFRAIAERNANIIYFRPFIDEDGLYVEKVNDYKEMFKDLSERLNGHGIEVGETQTYGNNTVRKIAALGLSLGIVSAGILVLRSLLKMSEKTQAIIFAIGMLFSMILVLLLGKTGYMTLALGTAVIFPSLGIVYYNSVMKRVYLYDTDNSYKDSIFKGIRAFVVSALITAIGSVIISAIMSSTRNILDIDYFVGVKIAQLIPFIVYVISFLGLFGFKSDKKRGEDYFTFNDFKSIMLENTKIFYFVLIGTVGVVGYVYLARTGHETGMEPSSAELIFRNLLERVLYARPRTKEFLIAFPALILGVTFAKNKLKPILFATGLAGVIGLTSIVNTFSHFKTPFLISAARLGYSVVFGVIVGAIYLLAMYGLFFAFKKIHRRLSDE